MDKRVSIRLYGSDADKYEYLKSIGVNVSEVFRKALRECYEEKHPIPPTALEEALAKNLGPALLLFANYLEDSKDERNIYEDEQ